MAKSRKKIQWASWRAKVEGLTTGQSPHPQVHSFQMGELVFQGVSGYLLLHKETLQRRSFWVYSNSQGDRSTKLLN